MVSRLLIFNYFAVDIPPEGLRILCFDGGGVRGKASLCMLKEIMDRIGPGAKPCDFFDLIAGTSTGALIAIMLARLGYTVSEAIKKYDELSPRIFSNVAPETVWITSGTPLVHEGHAEKAFREIGRVGNEDGLMGSGHNNRCKVLFPPHLVFNPVAYSLHLQVLRDHRIGRSSRKTGSHSLVYFYR